VRLQHEKVYKTTQVTRFLQAHTRTMEDINVWKTKRMLLLLKDVRGFGGTSMISLILRPGESISKMNQKLTEEFGTAGNIKSRVNRQSVLSAITSCQQKLKFYSKCPPNGLVIFCGDIITSEGKEKKMAVDFEPFRPVNTTLYLCDSRFHTEPLEQLLVDQKQFAFVIADGNGFLLAIVSGNSKQIVDKFLANLPSKTSRGGQSANRFARSRDEAKHELVRKICERMKLHLVNSEGKCSIEGLVIAGCADLKLDLVKSDMLDARVKEKIIATQDISYGGEKGLQHAILLSKDLLGNLRFVQEEELLAGLHDKMARCTGDITYSLKDTVTALEAGAVDTLILFENLKIQRIVYQNAEGERLVRYNKPVEAGTFGKKKEEDPTQTDTIIEEKLLLEWFVEVHKDHGAKLSFVSDSTSEGSKFVHGIGGIGALLRYKMDFEMYEDEDEEDDGELSDDSSVF
jgi:peptide chain release factor subunit 1